MSAGRAETKLAKKGRKTSIVSSQRKHSKWQDQTSNIPMMASHPGLEQKQAFECFSEVSATALHTLESKKNSYWMPRCLGGSKTKQLCHGELELGLPLHFLSHGKWERHQLWGASVILRACLSAPLFQMHLESNDSSGMNWSDPFTAAPPTPTQSARICQYETLKG